MSTRLTQTEEADKEMEKEIERDFIQPGSNKVEIGNTVIFHRDLPKEIPDEMIRPRPSRNPLLRILQILAQFKTLECGRTR